MQELFPTADNPAPKNAKHHGVFTQDGVELRAMTALISDAQGTVIVLNGRADFMERYFETMRDAQERGYAVASFDWRGQGGSQRVLHDRMRGHVRSFSDFDEDLRSFMSQVVMKHCPRPYYVIAHSTGGHVVLRALRGRTAFKKVVLSAPLVDLNYGWWPLSIVRLMNAITWSTGLSWIYLPGRKRGPLKRGDFKRNPLTSDERRYTRDIETIEKHPELGLGGPTYGWLTACMASIRELNNWPKHQPVSCPTLIVAAGRETVVNSRAARAFSQRVQGISFTQVEGSKHELLIEQDPYRKAFWGAFDAFIKV